MCACAARQECELAWEELFALMFVHYTQCLCITILLNLFPGYDAVVVIWTQQMCRRYEIAFCLLNQCMSHFNVLSF